MKNKHEQARALLEAMEQVDADLLQQAYATDTPERFRALGKAKKVPTRKDRPVSALRRWGAVAACLAVILALAASPWFFSTLLPAIIRPTEPTQPPVPPTTADATEPSEPELPIPNLFISNEGETITAYVVCGNWNYTWFDGLNATDLLESNRMPWLTTELFAFLEFETEPDGFEVQCWPADQEINSRGEEVTVADGMLHLKEGSYVYEVTAQWHNHGRITYVFAVTASFADTGYEFTSESGEYLWPSMIYNYVSKDALKATTECGTFVCFTEYAGLANHFVARQQELLNFLQENGMEAKELTYYATDYDDSYSRSDENEAYIALSAVKTWRQVLVTLQVIWGDYINYGYVYAVANAIAEELGWQTDTDATVDAEALSAFFLENPTCIALDYPSFTTLYATEEAVECSKALSKLLFAENFQLNILQYSIGYQLDVWYTALRDYANTVGIPFTKSLCRFAYCSWNIPLRISIDGAAELFIDGNYTDGNEVFRDAFSNYASIYETADRIYMDIEESREDWGNGNKRNRRMPIYFISEETADKQFGSNFKIRYVEPKYGEAVYTRYLTLYMYGYYKHIVYQWTDDLGQAWQSQAFCELGRSKSWFAQYAHEIAFTQDEAAIKVFYAYTSRAYEPGLEDYFEWMDIICHYNEMYTLSYNPTSPAASMGWYLTELYGEESTREMLLNPETVETHTGKTWKELESEWAQYIKDKYADVVIPEDFAE